MELKQLYRQLLGSVKGLEDRQRNLTNMLLDNQQLDVIPKLYLRGQFVQFDTESQSLEIRIDGERYFYPLSNYYSQWLPFPDHQVMIFRSEQGIQIFGFGEGGRQIPMARMRKLTLIRINSIYQTWTFRESEGEIVELPLCTDIGSIQIGQTYHFREIEAEPHRFWTLDLASDLATDRVEISNTLFSLIGNR